MKLTVISQKSWVEDQLQKKGLYYAVKDQLDELVALCEPLGYLESSEVAKRSQNILDLIQTFGEKFGVKKPT